jgi:hypothetical protein
LNKSHLRITFDKMTHVARWTGSFDACTPRLDGCEGMTALEAVAFRYVLEVFNFRVDTHWITELPPVHARQPLAVLGEAEGLPASASGRRRRERVEVAARFGH